MSQLDFGAWILEKVGPNFQTVLFPNYSSGFEQTERVCFLIMQLIFICYYFIYF